MNGRITKNRAVLFILYVGRVVTCKRLYAPSVHRFVTNLIVRFYSNSNSKLQLRLVKCLVQRQTVRVCIGHVKITVKQLVLIRRVRHYCKVERLVSRLVVLSIFESVTNVWLFAQTIFCIISSFFIFTYCVLL